MTILLNRRTAIIGGLGLALGLAACDDTSQTAKEFSACTDADSAAIAKFKDILKTTDTVADGRHCAGQDIDARIDDKSITVQTCGEGHYLFIDTKADKRALIDLVEKKNEDGSDGVDAAHIV